MTRRLSLTIEGRNFAVLLHRGDLPEGLRLGAVVALDTEAMGLSLARDRLCLVQLTDGKITDGKGEIHLVQIQSGAEPVRLKALLQDPATLKILHFARFDLGMIARHLGVVCAPVYCTKIASKLARTYTDKHGLKEVVRELLGRDVSKEQQSSDWGAQELSDAQLAYAASDVVHLHAVREKLDEMLAREGREGLAQACFAFLPTRAALDLAGWDEIDIFAHT